MFLFMSSENHRNWNAVQLRDNPAYRRFSKITPVRVDRTFHVKSKSVSSCMLGVPLAPFSQIFGEWVIEGFWLGKYSNLDFRLCPFTTTAPLRQFGPTGNRNYRSIWTASGCAFASLVSTIRWKSTMGQVKAIIPGENELGVGPRGKVEHKSWNASTIGQSLRRNPLPFAATHADNLDMRLVWIGTHQELGRRWVRVSVLGLGVGKYINLRPLGTTPTKLKNRNEISAAHMFWFVWCQYGCL